MDALEATGKPVVAVYGNIDDHTMRARYPEHQKFFLNGVKVWMTHIGGYPPKYNMRTREAIRKENPTCLSVVTVIFSRWSMTLRLIVYI